MSRCKTILITNLVLRSYSGTETYVRDFSLGLLREGYSPVAFSPQLGMISHELIRAGIPVVDNLDALGEPPDIIHGHHTLETMNAILRFPQVPAIFVCHDASAWHDTPPKFPQIHKYIGVDQATHDRMVMSHSIPQNSVEIIGNAIDLARFRNTRQIATQPRRALVFSNYMRPENLLEVRRACQKRGIELDALGQGHRNLSIHPESILPEYDLVFAKGRCALEAMACGAATIVCDVKGSGPLVTSTEFDFLRQNNFGRRLLTRPLDADYIGQQIDRYSKNDVEVVTARVRAECGVEKLTHQMIELYERGLSEFKTVSNEEIIKAAFRGSSWVMENWRDFAPKPIPPKENSPKKEISLLKKCKKALKGYRQLIRREWHSLRKSGSSAPKRSTETLEQSDDDFLKAA